jgi:uncharacterized delta-60 repeat protein
MQPRRGRWLAPLVALVLVALQATAGKAATNPDLDPSFSGDGETTTSFVGPAGAVTVALNGGNILVVGVTAPQSEPGRIALAQYRPDGSLDPGFGSDGRVTTGFTGKQVTTADLVVLPDRRFVVGATVESGSTAHFALARYRPNGSLDPSFGNGGKEVADLGIGAWYLRDVIRLANGKLVAGGARNTTSPGGREFGRFGVARFLPDGSVDRDYGDDGHVVTSFRTRPGGNDQESAANGLAVDVQGRIVAVGWTSPDSCHFRWALARYRPDGGLDTTFSGDGRVLTRSPSTTRAPRPSASGTTT